MGILRFLAKLAVKKGPGSVGETAKVMALAASQIYETSRPTSPRAFMEAIVESRYAAFPAVPALTKRLIVDRAMEGDAFARFPRLVQYCWESENGPMLSSVAPAHREAFGVALSVIYDQMRGYMAEDAREFLQAQGDKGVGRS